LEALQALDRVLLRMAVGTTRPVGMTAEHRELLRDASAAVWSDLPRVEGDLRAWNRAARNAIEPILRLLITDPAQTVNQALPDRAQFSGHDAVSVLAPRPPALARTIHDAKGESLAAVAVLAREDDVDGWLAEAWRNEPPLHTAEETRVFYVAITRAARVLVVALPESTTERHLERLMALGFVLDRA
jgi:hypothetical protein